MDTMVNNSPETVKISLPWKWRPLKRRMLPGCELFMDGDAAMRLARKLIPLEDDDDKYAKDTDCKQVIKETIPCSAVGCAQTFTSLLSYENHYNSMHRQVCQTCHRTFPSSHLLEIHIEENHDPIFALLVDRQPMYQCLVESCSQKFGSVEGRRQHMIQIHSYPASFRFHRLTPAGSQHRKKAACPDPTTTDNMETDKSSSASHSQTNNSDGDARRSSQLTGDARHSLQLAATSQTPSEPESDKENLAAGEGNPGQGLEGQDEGMDVSEAGKHAPPRRVFVHKVPQNFSFGHGASRGFQRPPNKKKTKKKGGHWHQREGNDSEETMTSNIENVDMKDMAAALSDAL